MGDATDPLLRWVRELALRRPAHISLQPIANSEIRRTLALWTAGGLNRDAVRAEHANGNIFARYLLRNRNPEPLRRALKSVATRWHVFGIAEEPYFDLEFWQSHSEFYDKVFVDHARYCTRIHFFSLAPHGFEIRHEGPEENGSTSEKCAVNHLIRLLQSGWTWEGIHRAFGRKNVSISYRGYVVLRPTLSFVVGRTAIEFDGRSEQQICDDLHQTQEAVRDQYGMLPAEADGRPFLKSSYRCDANLLGTNLSLNTVEFIQQDPNLGACATASLWVATHITSKTFGLNKFNYPTITKQALSPRRDSEANVIFDPVNLDTGLLPAESAHAITRTGGRALVALVEAGDPEREALRIRQEIYSFVESGIPVILGMSGDPEGKGTGHDVVVVGHNLASFKTSSTLGYMGAASEFLDNVAPHHFLVSALTPVYYAHDDSYGPFSRILFPPDGGRAEFKKRHRAFRHRNKKLLYPMIKRGNRGEIPMYLQEIIVPVSPIVRGGPEIRLRAAFDFFDASISDQLDTESGDGFLWRTLLVEGSELKASFKRRHYSTEIVEWYNQMAMPKYVWLFECSLLDEVNTWKRQFGPDCHRRVFAEFFYDATTSYRDSRCIAVRIQSTGYDRGSDDGGPSSLTTFKPDRRDLMYECYRPLPTTQESSNGRHR